MKKYLFVFTILALVATVACDTSSKASTTQTAAAPQTIAAPTTVQEPKFIPLDSTAAMDKGSFKKASKKNMQIERAEMAPAQKMTPQAVKNNN
jgi:hypothetical protein